MKMKAFLSPGTVPLIKSCMEHAIHSYVMPQGIQKLDFHFTLILQSEISIKQLLNIINSTIYIYCLNN